LGALDGPDEPPSILSLRDALYLDRLIHGAWFACRMPRKRTHDLDRSDREPGSAVVTTQPLLRNR
jgi:hypothetical protein